MGPCYLTRVSFTQADHSHRIGTDFGGGTVTFQTWARQLMTLLYQAYMAYSKACIGTSCATSSIA
jgi:hypothetical protein